MLNISVVIPVFNARSSVAEAVESAWAQTLPPREIVCVDDGSTDGSADLLRSLVAPRATSLAVLEQSNRGACAARNRGLQASSGRYVQFLDADDLLSPGKLEHQWTIAEQEGWPDVIVGSFDYVALDGGLTSFTFAERDLWPALARGQLGLTSGNLFSRDAVEEVGRWNEALESSQEYDLMFRLLQAGAKFVFDEAALTAIREREGSITTSDRTLNWIRRVGHVAEVRDYVRSQADLSCYRSEVESALFDSIRTLAKFDRATAFEAYQRLLGTGYKPQVSSGTTWRYIAAYKSLGFRRSESIRALLRTLRP